MSFKRYKSVFQESKKVNKKLSMKKESILNRFKRVLREEDLNSSDVEEIVSKIEDVITDVIGEHGVDNPVVDELSSTVKSINMQNKMVSDIDMMESKLNNKFRKIKENSMYDMEDDIMGDMDMDDEMDMYDTGYDTEMDDEFMYDSDSIMESEEDEEDDDMKEEYDKDEDEDDDMEESYDKDEKDEKEKKESYKRKLKIAEMKKRLKEADSEDEEEDDEEEIEESYYYEKEDEEEDDEEMKEEAESEEGDNLIDYDNGSDYDYLSSIDSEGNFSSGRGMEADMDDNKE